MLKNFTIKQRLLLILVISLISVFIVIFLSSRLNHTQAKLASIKNTLSKIEIAILQERRNEKDFLARKKQKYIDKLYNKTIYKFCIE